MNPKQVATTEITTANPVAMPSSWLEAAVHVLKGPSRPMNARQIVEAVQVARCTPPSRTRTPAQSVNRDLRAAVRRGDARVLLGPVAGQFIGAPASAGAERTPPSASREGASAVRRLPIGPLAVLIAARGGLRVCGVRYHPGDSIERAQWVARLQRAYLRSLQRGWISVYTADELAVKALWQHPCEIWGAQWWDAR
jgi:hypothetical protein